MKIAVIGGTGLIGSQVVRMLTTDGHDVLPLSPSTGVDLLTGAGLPEALAGADVVVNLTNSPTFDEASPAFFRTTMQNMLSAAASAGVGHAVILSIVGVDEVPDLDYYRAKVLQEELLQTGPVPYSIVRATQFYEFVDAVLSWTSDENTVRLPATPVQPMAAADVARAVADVAAGAPLNGIRNVAGPQVYGLDELGRVALSARGDRRAVVTDPAAGMFAAVPGDVLIGRADAVLARTTFLEWLSR
ncbi:SDR family oxidoreductase [Actinoplanes sp. CA-252034]|uniref:SDR family oxidoreductase n=1 Tax=Actinoplanes sp. CA-252034 TaxID=3239906 RepID=UPI003D977D78